MNCAIVLVKSSSVAIEIERSTGAAYFTLLAVTSRKRYKFSKLGSVLDVHVAHVA